MVKMYKQELSQRNALATSQSTLREIVAPNSSEGRNG